ncbi:uncharacterized protein E5676_scaffold127G00990 [Cucumis melo var. makuwa]|uniref:CACTA en-spm transposon protein n=1 Tax=Cucumis melo var. makuwa TaxID=1194695 RepID=A0A5D3CET1_CUCMM|nr:uncharacterized protein E5676_scaffold127G00990 [Cucumis melo var. makuwa]
MVSEMSSGVRGAFDVIFSSSGMALGNRNEREKEKISSAGKTKRGETFGCRRHCPRSREPAVMLLLPSGIAHPYLRCGSKIACKIALLEGVEVDDVENEYLNVLKIIVSHREDEHIEDATLYRIDVDPIIVERPVVHYITDDFIDDVGEHLAHASTMFSFSLAFFETNAMFLEFSEDIDNPAEGLSSMGNNTDTSQPSATSTPR